MKKNLTVCYAINDESVFDPEIKRIMEEFKEGEVNSPWFISTVAWGDPASQISDIQELLKENCSPEEMIEKIKGRIKQK